MAPLVFRPPRTEPDAVKLPLFWQDMGVHLGVYTKLAGGEEPVYLAMKLDADTIETAIRFLTVLKGKLPAPDLPLVDYTKT
jgi:hypothetical protein